MRYPLPVPTPRALAAATAATAIFLIGGCAVPSPKVDPVYLANVAAGPNETSTEAVGDWDDLGAALGIGLGKLNLAVVDSASPAPGVITLSLVDVLDRPATLRVERAMNEAAGAAAQGVGGRAPQTIRIAAAFTRIRDLEREKLLVAAIAQRFGELRGVDIAPAR